MKSAETVLTIGIVDRPLLQPCWQRIKQLLEPAAQLGGVPVLEPHEEVWTVHSDGDLLAAATARLTSDKDGEIVLCGGVNAPVWAAALSGRICHWFLTEGMVRARIYGRAGWARLLPEWNVVGVKGRITVLERLLR